MIKKNALVHKIKSKKKNNHGHLTIKKHHSKPYRKRHYGVLIILIVLFVALVAYAAVYRDRVNSATKSAQSYISSLFRQEASTSTVNSSYGFSISYDVNKFYAGAIDTASGDLFFGDELETKRAYDQVRFSKSKVGDLTEQSSMTVRYLPNLSVNSTDDSKLMDLEINEIKGKNAKDLPTLTKNSQSNITLDGYAFVKTDWTIKSKAFNNELSVNITTYRGVINSKPMVIKVATGLTKNNDYMDYNDVVNSIKFSENQLITYSVNDGISNETNSNQSSRLLNSLLFTSIAKAQAANQGDNTELLAAKYSPAVVQIWNFYCMDISINGSLYLTDACSASSGSGFFVGSNGYIATNGHVAASEPKDIIIEDAFFQYLENGDDQYLLYLAQQAGVTDSDLSRISDPLEQVDFLIDKLYAIGDSKITVKNNVSNKLVLLNEKTPDIEEVFDLTKKRKEYTEQDSVKKAKVEAIDYRAYDGLVKWRASDVAIIKIEGQNYPVVKTGSLGTVSQGASLFIIGYPAIASSNGIVEESKSQATLTSGKVSSIKNAKGSDKKIVETDTTIGHGNSGGPVFDSSGQVLGLATYTIDGSGDGNGVFNYVRDIKDLLDLAKNKSITLNQQSSTQTRWEEGLDLFYKARYSKSVKIFEEVKKNYPQHPKADQFIASANEKIKNGLDVKDAPYALIIIGVVILASGIVTTVVIIRKQKKKHSAYLQHVADNGGINPFANTGIRSIQVAPNTMNTNGFNNQAVGNPNPTQSLNGLASQTLTPQTTPTPNMNVGPSVPPVPTVQPTAVQINPTLYPSGATTNQPNQNNQNISTPNQGV